MNAAADNASRPMLAQCTDADEAVDSLKNVLQFLSLAIPAIAEGSADLDEHEADGLRIILDTCAGTLESLRPQRGAATGTVEPM